MKQFKIFAIAILAMTLSVKCTCTTPEVPGRSAPRVAFISPDDNSIYYTNSINDSGESYPDIVQLKVTINDDLFLESITLKVENSNEEAVFTKNIPVGEFTNGVVDFLISETFETTIVGNYEAILIVRDSYGNVVVERRTFIYQNQNDNGGGGNNDN